MSFTMGSQVDKENKLLRLSLEGELDIYHAPDFKRESVKVYDQAPMDIIIDGGGLTYVDSTGLGGFIHLYNHVKDQGHKIKLKNIKDNIKKLFVITKLDEVFDLEEGQDA